MKINEKIKFAKNLSRSRNGSFADIQHTTQIETLFGQITRNENITRQELEYGIKALFVKQYVEEKKNGRNKIFNWFRFKK